MRYVDVIHPFKTGLYIFIQIIYWYWLNAARLYNTKCPMQFADDSDIYNSKTNTINFYCHANIGMTITCIGVYEHQLSCDSTTYMSTRRCT